jgi:hypothetical protein
MKILEKKFENDVNNITLNEKIQTLKSKKFLIKEIIEDFYIDNKKIREKNKIIFEGNIELFNYEIYKYWKEEENKTKKKL